ncbi:sodium-dependent proline transporter-like isoform X1 [Mya arenaria]|uniref:sodium-dependent proline transporter-like isoform X1 n=2 Tax=Mya arenaria TaxID=6604 RepID=UPI0022E7995D|nr:sodium-dependent proline transporter-like isoform X1 [Mya arenaria]
MDGGMKAPLVSNEQAEHAGAYSPRSLSDVTFTNGDASKTDDAYIVSSVQPGIYSGFSADYGTVESAGSQQPRSGVWTRKQVFGVDENEERGNWTGRFEYLLSMLGYAVGLGNVWRFPYLCYRYGGGAFLLPYLLFMTFLGIPLFYMEASLGQLTSCGPTTCWGFAPLLQGLGIAMMISSFITSGYYCMIIAWCHFYFFASFTSDLPWTTCYQWWNTDDCRDRLPDVTCLDVGDVRSSNGTCHSGNGSFTGIWNYTMFKNVTGRERVAPTREYWERYVLRQSAGIEDTGQPQWRLVLCLLFSWTLVFLCLIKGIKSAGKVVYFTAIFPYIILVILFFRGVTLENAGKGIEFYVTPDFIKLRDTAVWKAAAVQIFYSMGPCWGGIIALSSYNRFHNNIYRDSMIVSLGNCMTSIFGGFVIFSFVGHMAGQLGVSVDHVADEGPGLAFIVYPEAVQSLPAPAFWAVIFFFMLITLGLDSQFASVEALLTGLLDIVPRYRQHKTIAIFIICIAMFLLGLPFTTRSGIYWVTLVDYYGAAWGVLLTGLVEVIAISYIYGVDRFCTDLAVMIGPWRTWYWKLCWVFITPAGTIFILLISWIDYRPVSYNKYFYPAWAENLGWLISFAAISSVPIVAVFKVATYKKDMSIGERIRHLMRPSREWGPALVKHRKLVKHVPGFIVDPEDWNHGVAFSYQNLDDTPTVTMQHMHGVTDGTAEA